MLAKGLNNRAILFMQGEEPRDSHVASPQMTMQVRMQKNISTLNLLIVLYLPPVLNPTTGHWSHIFMQKCSNNPYQGVTYSWLLSSHLYLAYLTRDGSGQVSCSNLCIVFIPTYIWHILLETEAVKYHAVTCGVCKARSYFLIVSSTVIWES